MVGSSGAERPPEPWECGDRVLGTAKLGIEVEVCGGDSIYVCGDVVVEHMLGGENLCRLIEK
jgi:hypothetical protein